MATSKRPALRKHDRVTLSAIKSVIPPYDGKPFVLRDTVLTVSHLTGTGSNRNPWRVVVTDGTHFWHLEPDDVARVENDAGGASHHATKKSPAQLDREIAEYLARSQPQALRNLSEIRLTTELRNMLTAQRLRQSAQRQRYIETLENELRARESKAFGESRRSHATLKSTVPGVLQKLKDYKARVRFEDQLKRVSQSREPDRPRWTAFVQGVFGHDVSGEGATKEAAVHAALSDLPLHVRRHFKGL